MENNFNYDETTFKSHCANSTVEQLREEYQPNEELPNEEFRDAVCYYGISEQHEISRRGIVRTKKTGKHLKWCGRNQAKIYPCVGIEAGGKRTAQYVHKLVSMTFWEEVISPEWLTKIMKVSDTEMKFRFITELLAVDHIDGISWNPNVKNLQFTTLVENVRSGMINYNKWAGHNVKEVSKL